MLAIAGVALLLAASLRTGAEEAELRKAPGFSLPSLRDESRTISLADYGGQPVVLNFWASWCVPCKKELPAFQKVSEATRGRVTFLGVDHQDGRQGALRMLDETGVEYPSAFDPGGHLAERYRLFGMPSTVFISADGRILETRTGELTEEELIERIERLFGLEVGRA